MDGSRVIAAFSDAYGARPGGGVINPGGAEGAGDSSVTMFDGTGTLGAERAGDAEIASEEPTSDSTATLEVGDRGGRGVCESLLGLACLSAGVIGRWGKEAKAGVEGLDDDACEGAFVVFLRSAGACLACEDCNRLSPAATPDRPDRWPRRVDRVEAGALGKGIEATADF